MLDSMSSINEGQLTAGKLMLSQKNKKHMSSSVIGAPNRNANDRISYADRKHDIMNSTVVGFMGGQASL